MTTEIKNRIEQIQRGEVPQGYKKTKIGIVPIEWDIKKFNNIFTIIANNTFSRSEMNDIKGDYYNIHYGDILIKYKETINCLNDKIPFINEENIVRDDMILKNGDIIFSDTAEDYTVGKAVELLNICDKKIVSGLHTIPCRPNKNFDSKWLGYFCNFTLYHNQLLPLATGTKVTSISKSSIRNTFIIIPPLPQQQKIADILSTQDKVIELKEKLIAEKQKQKKYLMQNLLTGKKRLKGFTEKWEIKKIVDIYKITRGNVLSTALIVNKLNNNYKYPVYSSQTKQNGLMGFYNNYLYENAITWTTDGANAGFVTYRKGKFYCTNVCGVLLNEKGYCNKCMAEILNSITKKYVSYVGNPKLMNNTMAKIKINFPPVAEQTAIAEILSTADREIELLQEELEQEKQRKKALMQLLLTGIVRVKI